MIIDVVSAAYFAYGVIRGRKRGLADESYRLLRLGVAFGSGCGLHGLVGSGMDKLVSLGNNVSAPLAFAGTMGCAWWLLRWIKCRFLDWVAKRFEAYMRIGGAIAGGLRTAVLLLSMAVTFVLAAQAPGHDAVRYGSWAGRIAGWIVQAR